MAWGAVVMVHLKRALFVGSILLGLMFASGEPLGDNTRFMGFLFAGCCFLFAWGCWENWRDALRGDWCDERESDKWNE